MIELRSFVSQVTLVCDPMDFPELFVHIRSIISMTPVEMHLKSFSDKLKLTPQPLCQNTSVLSCIGDVGSKGFGHRANELLNLS